MSFDHVCIYVTSGTGNTLRTVRWFEARAAERGADLTVQPIEVADPASELRGGEGELVGLACPTHGFTAPWHMIKFAARLPRGRGARAFALATRAALKFGPVYTPGISGSCTFLLALILVLKGYRVRGVDAFDMPSNWYSLHPPQKRASLDALIDRAQRRVERFADRLLDGGRSWRWQHLVYEGIWAIALSIVTCGYLLFGRLFLAKLFFANSRCDGCGICQKACPVGAIRMLGKADPRPYWSYHCESCMRCAPLCPHRAIEAGQSWGVLLYFLTALWVAYAGISALGQWLPITAEMHEGWLRYVLGVAYFYPTLFLSYAVFHVANRLKVVNWLFTHTTLTHFWGRYIEPNTRYKHLVAKKAKKPVNG